MNIRKLTSLVLAFALLSAPVFSLGESAPNSFLDQAYEAGRGIKTTVTFTPGELMNQVTDLAMFADLLKTLRIETSQQKQREDVLNHVELFLQDKSSFSATFLTKDEELHIMSNLLGDQILSFTQEEFASLYIKLLDGVPEDALNTDLNTFSSLHSFLTDPEGTFKKNVSYIESLGFNPINFQTDLVDPLTDWVSFIMFNPKVTTGVFESEKHDTAVTKKEYSISIEQLRIALQIFTAWAIQDENLIVLNNLASSYAIGTGEEPYDREETCRMLLTMPNEFVKAARGFLPKPVVITEFMDANGVRKAMEIRADIVEASTSTLIAGEYIKTESDGITTLYGLDISSEFINTSVSFLKKNIATVKKGDATITSSHWKASESIKQIGLFSEHIALTFDRQTSAGGKTIQDDWSLGLEMNTSDTTTDFSLEGSEKTAFNGIDAKAEGTVELYIRGGKEPACTIAYTTASYKPEAMPVIPGDSVRLGKMTTDELEAWAEEAYPMVLIQWMGLMSNLPPSILKPFISSTYP